MISKGKWNVNEFSEMKQNLLKMLKIEKKPDNKDIRTLLQELLEKVEKLENGAESEEIRKREN